ncbi:MAG: TIR domain-containing protein [Bacteroidales bacterium]|nr:TIR domain-containing protein [Bacteroidales bacterium]
MADQNTNVQRINQGRPVYFSYARNSNKKPEWSNISDCVEPLLQALDKEGIEYRVDVKDIGAGDKISAFEEEIGWKSEVVVIVFSDKYFRSMHCMYEFVQIKNAIQQYPDKRLICIKAGDFNLSDPNYIMELEDFWHDQKQEYEKIEFHRLRSHSGTEQAAWQNGFYLEDVRNLYSFFSAINYSNYKNVDYDGLVSDIIKYYKNTPKPVLTPKPPTIQKPAPKPPTQKPSAAASVNAPTVSTTVKSNANVHYTSQPQHSYSAASAPAPSQGSNIVKIVIVLSILVFCCFAGLLCAGALMDDDKPSTSSTTATNTEQTTTSNNTNTTTNLADVIVDEDAHYRKLLDDLVDEVLQTHFDIDLAILYADSVYTNYYYQADAYMLVDLAGCYCSILEAGTGMWDREDVETCRSIINKCYSRAETLPDYAELRKDKEYMKEIDYNKKWLKSYKYSSR